MKKVISTANAPQAIGPYSQAIEAGGFVFVSGQIPLIPATGELVEGSVEVHMGDFTKVNGIYGQYFQENPPARVCVEVSKLPKGALVEIDVIAAR